MKNLGLTVRRRALRACPQLQPPGVGAEAGVGRGVQQVAGELKGVGDGAGAALVAGVLKRA